MKKIPLYTLLGEIEKAGQHQQLYVATENDYKCYYMCYANFKEDQAKQVKYIGYSANVELEGKQFCSVCRIEAGKITQLAVRVDEKAIALLKIYIDNLEGKNIIE